MKKYILYSTLFGLFTEALRIRAGIDLKLMYLIFFVNYIVLLSFNKIVIPKFLIYIIIYLLFSGIIGCLLQTDTFSLALSQILGIGISILYFYNFYKYIDWDIADLFELYVKIAVYLSMLGIIIFAFNMLIGQTDYRLQSLMLEPAHYCGITLPAFYYLAKNFRKNKFWLTCVTISILLAGSSIGYIGILLSIVIFNKRIFVLRNIIVYALVVLLGIGAYLTIDNVKLRVDDTFNSAQTLDISGANWSTYALIANVFVTKNVLMHSPVIGNGLGSHELSHKKYIGNLLGIETLTVHQDINATDADSLTLRVLSDMGLLGFFLVLLYIHKFYSKEDELYVLSRALIVYFFYKLFREGHYFPPEMYFFVFAYYFLNKQTLGQKKTG